MFGFYSSMITLIDIKIDRMEISILILLCRYIVFDSW